MQKTPLYDVHVDAGAKLIDFGGWMMPVQYTSIIDEHMAVRERAGIFDVSHMGEILIEGREAEGFLQKMLTNDISRTHEGRIVYSPICYPNGGVVDDVLVYKLHQERFLMVTNAANTAKDYEWLLTHREGEVKVKDVSRDYAQLAVQGPNAEQILNSLTDSDLGGIKFFRFADDILIDGVEALISRTGYTGEDGFEIYIAPEYVVRLWHSIMEVGKDYNIMPAGLGARDTLRFEAALPLYGHEISKDISPLEGGLEKFVKLDKDDFIGKDTLLAQVEQGIERTLVGFEMIDRGIAREGYEVLSNGRPIGHVTSGSYSPSLDKNLGIALMKTGGDIKDGELEIVVRKRRLRARLTKLPFYTKQYKK